MFTLLAQHRQRWYGTPMTHTTPPPKYDIDRFATFTGESKVQIADRAGVSRSVLYRAAAGEGLSITSMRKLYDAYPKAAVESGLLAAFTEFSNLSLFDDEDSIDEPGDDQQAAKDDDTCECPSTMHGAQHLMPRGGVVATRLKPDTQRIDEMEARVTQLEATMDGLLRGMIGVLADHLMVGGGRRHG